MRVDVARVRRLLREQHPDLADRPLVVAASGWDNVLLRLGDDLAVRLPHRPEAARLVEHEQRWLPVLAPRLPLPVPVPVRLGRPGAGFPWPGSVVPWLAGRPASMAPPDDPVDAALVLGAFLAALHQPAPPEAPRNPLRGVPLGERRERFDQHVRAAAAAGLLDAREATARWEDLAATDPWDGPRLWLHGDVHPGNLLVDGGRIAGVVDFGDLCGGDRATDLSVAWTLLPPSARPVFRQACGAGPAGPVDDATWRRAQGWAFTIAVALLASAGSDADVDRLARRVVDEILSTPGGPRRTRSPRGRPG